MSKYYVLSHIDEFEPCIYPFDNIQEALDYYQEQVGLGNTPVLTKELTVKVVVDIEENEADEWGQYGGYND